MLDLEIEIFCLTFEIVIFEKKESSRPSFFVFAASILMHYPLRAVFCLSVRTYVRTNVLYTTRTYVVYVD